MPLHSIPLHFTPGFRWAHLRELCGYDEQVVEDHGTAGAIRLLDLILVEAEGAAGPGNASLLAAADRDRLLAVIYQNTFGDRIESTVTCAACSEPFDLDFSLGALIEHLQSPENEPETDRTPSGGRAFDIPDTEAQTGVFTLPGGTRFRLPTGEDEFAITGLPPAEAERLLLQRCLLEGDVQVDGTAVQAAMQKVAPLLGMEMTAKCPECGREQPVYFDIQSFLLLALREEQDRLAREVHRLAMAYRWELRDILNIPRRQRRAYVSLIEAEYEAFQSGYS